MRIDCNFCDCAATYLNKVPVVQKIEPSKKEKKVEAIPAVYTRGGKFNPNAANKAAHSHIDICI